jgi:hypothetical protein
MEPTIIAAIISAGVKLASTFIEKWSSTKTSDAKQQKVDKWVKNNYEELKGSITGNCVKLLLAVEYGESFRVDDFRKILHPQLTLNELEIVFDLEFQYRLEYLTLIGLLNKGMREYTISRLGASFLREARQRKDYIEILHRQTSPNTV